MKATAALRKTAAGVACAAALLAPAVAGAANVKQTGFIKGDKAAPVKLRVGLNKAGKPRKVAGFRAEHVLAECNGKKQIRITLRALSPIRLDKKRRFDASLRDPDGGVLRIKGRVAKNGSRTVGSVKTNEFHSAKLTCQVAKQRFATSAR